MISCTASANVVNWSSSPPHCTFFLEGKTPLAVGSVGGNATGARALLLFSITYCGRSLSFHAYSGIGLPSVTVIHGPGTS